MLYIKGICCNCNIFISEVKNNNCYDIKIKIVQLYSVNILIWIKIFLHQNVRRVCTDLHLHGVHLLVHFVINFIFHVEYSSSLHTSVIWILTIAVTIVHFYWISVGDRYVMWLWLTDMQKVMMLLMTSRSASKSAMCDVSNAALGVTWIQTRSAHCITWIWLLSLHSVRIFSLVNSSANICGHALLWEPCPGVERSTSRHFHLALWHVRGEVLRAVLHLCPMVVVRVMSHVLDMF